MSNHAALFREAADAIDNLDEEVKSVNESKKDIFASVRDEVSPEDFKAFKEAIKLRRLRRADKDAAERHDERVWSVLKLLEAVGQPDEAETPPAATVGPAIGILEEQAPTRAPAHTPDAREEPPHDPDTGELTEGIPDFLRRKREAA